VIDGKGASVMAYSPDGKWFAIGDSAGMVKYYKTGVDMERPRMECWRHNSKVVAMSWSPDSKRLCTGGIGRDLIMWWIGDKRGKVQLKLAHFNGVNAVEFFASGTDLVSVGDDNAVRWWSFALPAPEKK